MASEKLGVCGRGSEGHGPRFLHVQHKDCYFWQPIPDKPVPAPASSATKHQICGLCGCVRGSCPHDDCQCYLHQIPAEAGVAAYRVMAMDDKQVDGSRLVMTNVSAEAGEVERQEFEKLYFALDDADKLSEYRFDACWQIWQAARAPK